ncbi:MAG: hypothetical protein ABIH08_02480 [Candidatus Omnitrophota bacterium]
MLVTRWKIHKILFVFCSAWFVFLCFLHYFSARPLWLDENFILNNIKRLSPAAIFGPLKNSQAFPRVYLALIKYFSRIFNYSVFSLRLFPLISMVSGFFIWAKVYKREFSSQANYLLTLFVFSGSYYLSYYAAELKHYSMDVLAMSIFCFYLTYQRQYLDSAKAPSKLFMGATFLLPLTLLFSYSSFFVFWVVAYNFIFSVKNNSKFALFLAGYSFICFLFLIFIFFFDLRHTLSTAPLFSYWSDYFVDISSLTEFFKTFGEGLRKLAVWWFGNSTFFRRAAFIFIPVFVFSLFKFGIKSIKENKFKFLDINALALVVFIELFILGILKKYPFTGGRITLFFAPFVFYLIVQGINSFKKIRPLYLSLIIFYIGFFLLCSLNSFLSYLRLYG